MKNDKLFDKQKDELLDSDVCVLDSFHLIIIGMIIAATIAAVRSDPIKVDITQSFVHLLVKPPSLLKLTRENNRMTLECICVVYLSLKVRFRRTVTD